MISPGKSSAPFGMCKDHDLRKIHKQFKVGSGNSTTAMTKRPSTQDAASGFKNRSAVASSKNVPKGLNSKERHLEVTKFRHQKILYASSNSVEGVWKLRQKDKIESIFNH